MRLIIFFITSLFLTTPAFAMTTASSHHPAELIESLKNDPNAGEKVYNEFCVACHAVKPQIPLGAPRKGMKSDWDYRLKNKKSMLKKTQEGFGNMPARGGCFECTDELLQVATDYMLPKKPKAVEHDTVLSPQ